MNQIIFIFVIFIVFSQSFLEYNYEEFPGNHISEDKAMDDTQLAQIKTSEEGRVDQIDAEDEVLLCVTDWDEKEAFSIYEQNSELFSHLGVECDQTPVSMNHL